MSNCDRLATAIEAATNAKDRGELLWPRPLIECFEEARPTSAMFFAINAVRQCPLSRQLDQWLASLSELVGSPAIDDAETCKQQAEAIWYFESRVDFIQRAVSRLYFAWPFYLQGDKSAYRLEIARALCVFSHSPCESGLILDDRFEMVVDAAKQIGREHLE